MPPKNVGAKQRTIKPVAKHIVPTNPAANKSTCHSIPTLARSGEHKRTETGSAAPGSAESPLVIKSDSDSVSAEEAEEAADAALTQPASKKRSRAEPTREKKQQQGKEEETDNDEPLAKRVASGEARSKSTTAVPAPVTPTPATVSVTYHLSQSPENLVEDSATRTAAAPMRSVDLFQPHYAARTNLSSAFRSVRKDQTKNQFSRVDALWPSTFPTFCTVPPKLRTELMRDTNARVRASAEATPGASKMFGENRIIGRRHAADGKKAGRVGPMAGVKDTERKAGWGEARQELMKTRDGDGDGGAVVANAAGNSYHNSVDKHHVEEAYGDTDAYADDEASSGVELLSDLDGMDLDLVDEVRDSQTKVLDASGHDYYEYSITPTAAATRTHVLAPPVVAQLSPRHRSVAPSSPPSPSPTTPHSTLVQPPPITRTGTADRVPAIPVIDLTEATPSGTPSPPHIPAKDITALTTELKIPAGMRGDGEKAKVWHVDSNLDEEESDSTKLKIRKRFWEEDEYEDSENENKQMQDKRKGQKKSLMGITRNGDSKAGELREVQARMQSQTQMQLQKQSQTARQEQILEGQDMHQQELRPTPTQPPQVKQKYVVEKPKKTTGIARSYERVQKRTTTPMSTSASASANKVLTLSTPTPISPYGKISAPRYSRFASLLRSAIRSHTLFANIEKEETLFRCVAGINAIISQSGKELRLAEVSAAFVYLAKNQEVVLKKEMVTLAGEDW